MERRFPRDTAWAMSEENVELVRRAFEVFNHGGPEAVIREVFGRQSLCGIFPERHSRTWRLSRL